MADIRLKEEDLPRYTYDDYAQWEGKWELIEGVPFAMTPAPAKKHQKITVKIISQLEQLLAACPYCETYLPRDWQINENTVVQPDLLVVCGDDPEEKKLVVTPAIIFEVLSPSTTRKDRGIKYRLYEAAGVQYYCIVDPESNCAEIYQLEKKRFTDREEFKNGTITFFLDKCSFDFDFGKLFAPPKKGARGKP